MLFNFFFANIYTNRKNKIDALLILIFEGYLENITIWENFF